MGVCIWEEEERVQSSGGKHLYELEKPDVHSNHGLHGRGVCHMARNDIEVWSSIVDSKYSTVPGGIESLRRKTMEFICLCRKPCKPTPYYTPQCRCNLTKRLPYVRRHDRINFVRIESSSQLAAHASPHVESREVFPTFLQEGSADSHCSLTVGQVMMVGLDSVEEIMMFVGCLAEKVQWYESVWSFRRGFDCVGKCGRPTL